MGMVMAIGIFLAYSLPHLPIHSSLLARLFTLELLVVWCYIAGSYVRTIVRGKFLRMHIADPLGRFGLGTWVAGTAVPAALVADTLPELHLLAVLLAVIAFVVYLPYLALFLHGYYRLLKRPRQQNANGVILLATVSTQSVLIAFIAVFKPDVPDAVATGLFIFDLFFLCSGITLITINFHSISARRLAAGWKNTNCIIHGAVSITGLGLLLTFDFGIPMLYGLWRVILVLFVVIEIVELVRLVERETRLGIRQALLPYNTSQWTRNFTYGMFYAFSVSLYQQMGAESARNTDVWFLALEFISQWGQFVVLGVLLFEIALFLRYRMHRFDGTHSAGVIEQ